MQIGLILLLICFSFAEKFMKVKDVKVGMKGYGFTVFRSPQLSKFDVEVIGVLKNALPKQDVVLVKCSHPLLEKTNIVSGMSGSPIYIEGKLLGALAFTWAFAKEPYAGVTPIEYMTSDSERPLEGYGKILPRNSSLRFCLTPIAVSGIAINLLEEFTPKFKEMGYLLFPAGGKSKRKYPDIKPGSSIGIQFIKGDIQMAGIGTVTYVDGRRVLAFGHPSFLSGEIDIPMISCEIHDVFPSQYVSFKLSSLGEEIGVFNRDFLSCISGNLGERAKNIFPAKIFVKNKVTHYEKEFNVEVINQDMLTPLLLTMVTYNSLLTAEPSKLKEITITSEMKLKIKDYGEFIKKEKWIYGGGFPYEISYLFSNIYFNPFRKIKIEQAEMKFFIERKKLVASIESAWLDLPEVKPGEDVEVNVILKPYGQLPILEKMSFRIPKGFFPGEYKIMVASGGSIYSPPQAIDFTTFLQNVEKKYPNNTLAVVMYLPSIGIVQKGKRMTNLPLSLFSSLLGSASPETTFQQDKLEVLKETKWVIIGRKLLTLKVKL